MGDTQPYPLGIIGGGNMAEAIVRAAIHNGIADAGCVHVVDPSEPRRALFEQLGANAYDSISGMMQAAGNEAQIVLAIKPQAFGEVAPEVAEHVAGQVFISIMAGVTTARIARAVGKPLRIVRVMPNTPLMVGLGMAGIASNRNCKPGDDEFAVALFSAGKSKAVRVNEDDLNAITAVSGSGPAYVFYLAEAMQDAARKMGLSEHAEVLVSQTVLGAAHLLVHSQEAGTDTAADLRKKVTSPGGTTEAAITFMEAHNVDMTIVEALQKARDRGDELAGD